MAKRTYKSITSYLSYKYFSRVNREKWKDEYKQRTGRETARGWNYSEEYGKFRESQRGRIITFAKRNPVQFFDNKDRVLKYSDLTQSAYETFSDTPTPAGELLNPMKGKDNFGPARLVNQAKNRGARTGKNVTTIIRINAPEELGGSRTVSSMNELQAVRGEIMRNYGQNIAGDKLPGSYDLIGANYATEYYESGNDLLAVIEVDLFFY